MIDDFLENHFDSVQTISINSYDDFIYLTYDQLELKETDFDYDQFMRNHHDRNYNLDQTMEIEGIKIILKKSLVPVSVNMKMSLARINHDIETLLNEKLSQSEYHVYTEIINESEQFVIVSVLVRKTI